MSKYYSLPFTVHFDEIGYEEFESVELAAYHPDEGSIVCVRQRGSSKDSAVAKPHLARKLLTVAKSKHPAKKLLTQVIC